MRKENEACKLRLDPVARFPKKMVFGRLASTNKSGSPKEQCLDYDLAKFQFSSFANGLKNAAQTFDYDRKLIPFYDLDTLLTQRNVKNATNHRPCPPKARQFVCDKLCTGELPSGEFGP